MQELDLTTVAVYSEADEEALHVVRQTRRCRFGKAHARHSYLNLEVLIGAARDVGADVITLGYGLLFSEECAVRSRRCDAAGIVFVGPSAGAIRRYGRQGGRAPARPRGGHSFRWFRAEMHPGTSRRRSPPPPMSGIPSS